MQELFMDLGERSYSLYIDSGSFDRAGKYIRDSLPSTDKIMIVTDSNVENIYGDIIMVKLEDAGFNVEKAVFTPGETSKCLKETERLYDLLLDRGFQRSSAVASFGGGVAGDLAGFAASTYMRGINFIQIPTSLLAQVDSSIGGKVAVNHPRAKNIIGSFYQPEMVFIDVKTLETLPEREFSSGMAEVIKHGFGLDTNFLAWLENNYDEIQSMDPGALERMITLSCRIKMEVVKKDEIENKGIRARLNFGHTVGHALEMADESGKFRHGEAVAAGMLAEARLAWREGLLEGEAISRLEKLLNKFSLPTKISASQTGQVEDLMKFIKRDKKARRGEIRFALPEKPGNIIIYDSWNEDNLLEVLREMR